MFEQNAAMWSRYLTELTLGFHIIFATIGVGIPLMIALAQWIGIKRNDPHYLLLARRWTRGFVITVAVGVVTGTAIGLQLSLLWPNFMEIAGQAIALPLFMETFAFFFEAIFLGIYIYTWDRFKNPMRHFLILIPVAIGATMSAFFITTVNSFMNAPQGFEMVDGVITNIQPIAAMFNPATPTKVSHVLSSAYMTSAFVLASIAAVQLWKGKRHVYYKKALHITLGVAMVFSVVTALVGDLSGKYLAEYQPEKLAAAEWHFETEGEAPLILFGTLDDNNTIHGEIRLPYALSILAYSAPGAEVVGLDQFPKDEQPPLYIHYLFDIMVTIGVALTILSIGYFLLRRWKPNWIYQKWFLFPLMASGVLAIIAMEVGWVFAEVGRQPWILRGYMKTIEGVTTSDHVEILFYGFSALYLLLAIGVVTVLRKLFKNNPPEKELKEMGLE